ncbi:phospholipase D-like domain-containing protein [Acidithiobacillus ferriphilus]|uniref:phospholipase D-like domain-containing protein n=1 Tax=Acidithiobacillus ferriphilus TaxID=1689834 RepID=UPI001C075B7A|nr:phospholipase D-like domain-containing protein [Acidithiobacillus ferriphilus]MBU2834066.1 hypothetical protein [Acidithiobacillus ferriphilus]
MLLAGDKYLDKVSNLIKNGRKIRIAVAFWGAESESLFDGFSGKYLQIICNLSMGGSNPIVIEKLMAMKNAEIRQLDQLHAKLVLSDKGMVVGSANMSANGLGFEGKESDGFFELGIYTTDSILLTEAVHWFDKKWNKARTIDERDVELAKKAWLRRRSFRPPQKNNLKEKSGLLEMNIADLKDRSVYFVIYRNSALEEAKRYLDKVSDREELSGGKLDIYSGWDDGQLPREHGDIIIPIYVGVHGGLKIYSPQTPLPELRKATRSASWDVTVIMKKAGYSNILPFRFGNKDRQDLVKPIRKWFDECLVEEFENNENGLTKPVSDFLKWKNSQ